MMDPKKLTYMERKLYGPWYVRLGYFMKEVAVPLIALIVGIFVCCIDDFPAEWLLLQF